MLHGAGARARAKSSCRRLRTARQAPHAAKKSSSSKSGRGDADVAADLPTVTVEGERTLMSRMKGSERDTVVIRRIAAFLDRLPCSHRACTQDFQGSETILLRGFACRVMARLHKGILRWLLGGSACGFRQRDREWKEAAGVEDEQKEELHALRDELQVQLQLQSSWDGVLICTRDVRLLSTMIGSLPLDRMRLLGVDTVGRPGISSRRGSRRTC